MPLKVRISAAPVGIQHTITAGKFDGTLPSGEQSFVNGINKYAAGSTGGLFYFENYKPALVSSYSFDFGSDSATYELAVVSLDADGNKIPGDRILLEKGAGRVLTGPVHYGFLLGAQQALELKVTSSTSASMVGVVWALDATAAFVG